MSAETAPETAGDAEWCMHADMVYVQTWLNALENPDAALWRAWASVYGGGPGLPGERAQLLRSVCRRFLERFGDRPVRVYRAPARINLRGMHVDTHGGYLNLMTHQRETVLVAADAPDSCCTFVNIDENFTECSFDLAAYAESALFSGPWAAFLDSFDADAADRQGWGGYLRGGMLRALHGADRAPKGVCAAVGSDIPRGAALSSSHALTLGVLLAGLDAIGRTLPDGALILATRDAEWFTGARTGTSDQGAMILGGVGEMVNAVLFPAELALDTVRRLPFPEALRVLVIDSHTTRRIGGAEAVAYNRNRFAYSLGLGILRQELAATGWPPERLAGLDRFARVNPGALGGLEAFYAVLARVPRRITRGELERRYTLPDLPREYGRYFGGVPEEERPHTFDIRGPLLYGLAESERAKRFFDLIAAGDYPGAARLMNIGHDGDRAARAARQPVAEDISSSALRAFAAAGRPLETVPGVYGASSRALDALVDAALQWGALGACLTGAGIAGSVLALCRAETADQVTRGVQARLASPAYPALAGRAEPLSVPEIEQAVVVNRATARAGRITLP